MANMTSQPLAELRRVIRTCPIIDNHAHNLLRLPQLKTAEFLSSTSEAEGEALQDHIHALPHLRAARQLRKLYCLPEETDWETILKTRKQLLETDAKELIKRCLEGTHAILIDDGLEGSFEKYSWHGQFTTAPCKRIVRVETIAAEILSALHQQGKLPVGTAVANEEACSLAWVAFITAFEQAIAVYLADEDVVGFKSVVCYRTGLDVYVQRDIDVTESGLRSFRRHYLPHCTRTGFRVQTKGMNDALVISACKLIDADYKNRGMAKPLQFHTGLGDNDISLLQSNPAQLQPLIKHFPNVPIVLLHSAYPYTREAGYLATVYKNVYLDIGLVFPMVSRDGQEMIFRQALEITPTSKILWSTDGHHHPETYWLANVQGREAVEKVFCDYVNNADLTLSQAIRAVQDILFENSNILYDLGLELPDSNSQPAEALVGASTAPSSVTPLALKQLAPSRSTYATQTLSRSPTTEDTSSFVFVQWLDYMAQMRSRWFPLTEFQRLHRSGPIRIAISRGNLGTTQNDHMSSVCDPVGSIYVEPDLESFRPMQSTGEVRNGYTVMSCFVDETGTGSLLCPRYALQHFADISKREFDITFLVGFEIEITFCARGDNGSFVPMDTLHAWGTFTDQQYTRSLGLMTSIATELQNIGILIQQLHSEAGAGQYEFVLPPLPPVQAVDTLIQARQCIQQMAAGRNLRATCHPMPFPGIGTAAHAHISLNSEKLSAAEIEKAESSFIASILEHLPAIVAITMPQAESYGRVVDDGWTGGTWVAWGTNNRETPLRKVCPGRWEIRCLDGTANMYLALATILGVGLSGVRKKLELTIKDCPRNPSKLSDEEKTALGIVGRIPRTLEEALAALEKNDEVKKELELVKNWIEVKKAEQEMLAKMIEAGRRIWLIERY